MKPVWQGVIYVDGDEKDIVKWIAADTVDLAEAYAIQQGWSFNGPMTRTSGVEPVLESGVDAILDEIGNVIDKR